MVLLNNYLDEVAKRIAGETSSLPAWLATSNVDGSVTTSTDALPNEIGSRQTVTTSRTDREIVYSATRRATDVVDTSNGDTLEGLGFMASETNDDLQIFLDLAPVTHTLDFDVEVSARVRVERDVQ